MITQSAVDDSIWLPSKSSQNEPIRGPAFSIEKYEEFVPVQPVAHKWSDRTKNIEQALFPDMYFADSIPARLPILVTPE